MARWFTIITLMLGLGLTAFESFREPEARTQPVTMSTGSGNALEGGSGFPSPRP